MSLDRSLKVRSALTRHRNVLSRPERIEKLKSEEKWSEENSLFGLPKVAHRKSRAGKKEKEAPKEGAEAVAVVGADAAAAKTAAPKGAVDAAKTAKPAVAKGAAPKAAEPAKGAKGTPAGGKPAGKK